MSAKTSLRPSAESGLLAALKPHLRWCREAWEFENESKAMRAWLVQEFGEKEAVRLMGLLMADADVKRAGRLK